MSHERGQVGAQPTGTEGLPRGTWQERSFRPAWWARGPHLQTLAGKFLRSRRDPGLRRERWETPDGDVLDLDFMPEPQRPVVAPSDEEAGSLGPVVLVLHGLEGSTRRPYALHAYRELAARGIRAVGLNFRGCGGEPNRLARFYHSGETSDLALVLERLRERHPGRPLGALGFSLGGNVLLKFLGERGAQVRDLVSAAAVVSVPFDLAAGCALLESSPMGAVYTRYFVRSLLSKVEAKAHLLEGRLSLDRVRASRTLREFDEAATAPLHGFPSADDYYRRSSSGAWLSGVRVPTLVLHSLDDPFLPTASIPFGELRSNPWLQGVVAEQGGHVGFVHGSPWAPRFWAEGEAARYLDLHLREAREGDALAGAPRAGSSNEGPIRSESQL